jgi:hypothetical protein
MIKIQPISENDAQGEIKNIYHSIKTILDLSSVPLIFQYMAAFPHYLSYIWEQTIKNLNSNFYNQSADDIKNFAQTAIDGIYLPSTLASLFRDKIKYDPKKQTLTEFSDKNMIVSSKLYLLALGIRESIKGKFLGIKLFGVKISGKEEKIFNDFTDGFIGEKMKYKDYKQNIENETIHKIIKISNNLQMNGQNHHAITYSLTSEFIKIIDHEMRSLIRMESYLTRRVELERFSLNKLYLLPYPLDSSLTRVISKSQDNPSFPELIYLVSELFPTQTPYKLMASAIMRKLLK